MDRPEEPAAEDELTAPSNRSTIPPNAPKSDASPSDASPSDPDSSSTNPKLGGEIGIGFNLAGSEKTAIEETEAEEFPKATRNFLTLALYQIVMRTGWIFKTESVIVPAVLGMIGGSSWMRGFLPLLNRFGQSIPPLLFADTLKRLPKKRVATIVCTMVMAACFLFLALLFHITGGVPSFGLQIIFLFVYGIFFLTVGINQLTFGTLTGKLIPKTSRGRLLVTANMVGAVIAVIFAIVLLPQWLTDEGGNFVAIFTFVGVCFVIGGFCLFFLSENRDNYEVQTRKVSDVFRQSISSIRADRNLAKACLVGASFGCAFLLFPHYVQMAKKNLGTDFHSLLTWVVLQNLGTGIFSLGFGLLADKVGYRAVLRICMLMLCTPPILATVISQFGEPAANYYSIVFVMVGITPVTIKSINNYTLELTTKEHHPQYLSTVAMCVSLPVLTFAPLAGLMIDWVGFEPVMIATLFFLLGGWLITLTIIEPRTELKHA